MRIMKSKLEIVEVDRFETGPYRCSYLPQETAELEYRIVSEISPDAYESLLSRGWRRFGHNFFRPACQGCQQCRSLRIIVDEFAPSRSQRRALKANQGIEVVIQPPSITREHLRVYNAYHADMHVRRGWPARGITKREYEETFVAGGGEFAREFLYLDQGRLVGVGLADVLPTSLSSVYFFHDPEWRSQSPGTFSVLQQMAHCRQLGLRHQYLGYWVAACQSMKYKASYRPHELLQRYPDDDEAPVWVRADHNSD